MKEGGTAVSEVSAENNHEGTDEISRPEWLPSGGEFSQISSPEDLTKGYSGAVRKITEQGQLLSQREQELADLRAQLDEVRAAQQAPVQQAQENEIAQTLYEMYESGDGRQIAQANAYLMQQATAPIMEQLEQLKNPSLHPAVTSIVAQNAKAAVAAKYENWSEWEPKVAEVIQANPVLRQMVADTSNPNGITEALDTATKLVMFEAGKSASQQAEQAIEEINRQVKNQAQTMTGSNSTGEQPSPFDLIKQAKSGIPPFGR